jgi:predicted RNA-binding protein with PUA-like domain
LRASVPSYWLIKSEPDVYGIDQMEKDGTTFWNGVRNNAARLHLLAMNAGDLCFFYHRNAEPSAIVGVVEVVEAARPDPTQFDKAAGEDMGYDPKSTREKPRWVGVTVKFRERLANPIALPDIKGSKALAEMALVKISRLSVSPVRAKEWKTILAMAAKQR